jgi:O-antigen ligase
MSAAAWLIVGYVVVTRIGNLQAAKLGGHLGGVPIFLTEIFLMLSWAATMVSRPIPFITWILSGSLAGPVGRTVWLIAVLATVQFALAFSEYRVYAARDFAIYMYSLFFILTYFAVTRREHAVRLLLWSIYAGVTAAILLIVTTVTDLDLGLFGEGNRYVLGEVIDSVGSGDVGGIIAFSLAGLAAYILLDRRHRSFNIACAVACLAAITLPQTRSAIFGLMLAVTFSMFSLGARHRVVLCCLALFVVGVVAASPLLPDYIPGATEVQNLYAAVVSGAEYHADGNAQFRLIRWHFALGTWLKAPLFGVGFGTDILPNWLLTIDELNSFNYGMPHNTYLTILARTGVIGLALFAFPIFWILRRVQRLMRSGWGDAHLLAAGNMICAMAGFGLFVLFFERPMHGATFWVMMAVAVRLVEFAEEARRVGRSPATISDRSVESAP